MEPGWPLLTARRKAKASLPRSSPSKMRSGRMRRDARSRSSASTCASPCSPRTAIRPTALGRSRRISGASSITSNRSLVSISRTKAFSKVVLPVEVPPLITMVFLARTAFFKKPLRSPLFSIAASSSSRAERRPAAGPSAKSPVCARSSTDRSEITCLRMAMAMPSRVAGGATICTRPPSGRVADNKGCSRLTPWWVAAAIWRASRLSTTSVTCGAAMRVSMPLVVSIHTSPGRLINRSVTSSRVNHGASADR